MAQTDQKYETIKTSSGCSTNSGSKIPQRHDFGIGFSSCSICEAPRCLNRGCKETSRVICEECWPAYARGLTLSFTDLTTDLTSLQSGATTPPPPDLEGDQLGIFGKEDQFPLDDVYQLNPLVGSWNVLEMPHGVESAVVLAPIDSSDNMLTASATHHGEDASHSDKVYSEAEMLVTGELYFESACLRAPLKVVPEHLPELTADTMSPKSSSKDTKPRRRVTVTFVGSLGIEFEEDTVISVEPDGQADRAGVAIGWKLRELNGRTCMFFGDKRLRAASKSNNPYDVIFEVSMDDDVNTDAALLMDCKKTQNLITNSHADLFVPSRSLRVREGATENDDALICDLEAKLHDNENVEPALPMDFATKTQTTSTSSHTDLATLSSQGTSDNDEEVWISDLEAKLQEQHREAVALLATVEKRASRVAAGINEIELRKSQDLSQKAQSEQFVQKALQQYEHDPANALSETDKRKLDQYHASLVASKGRSRANLIGMSVESSEVEEERCCAPTKLASSVEREQESRKKVAKQRETIKQRQKQDADDLMRRIESQRREIEVEEAAPKSQSRPPIQGCGIGDWTCATTCTTHDQCQSLVKRESWSLSWLYDMVYDKLYVRSI